MTQAPWTLIWHQRQSAEKVSLLKLAAQGEKFLKLINLSTFQLAHVTDPTTLVALTTTHFRKMLCARLMASLLQ